MTGTEISVRRMAFFVEKILETAEKVTNAAPPVS
jgi:hypothetical protein